MNLVERAKHILINPKKEWEIIKGENLTIVEMYIQYAVVLAAIPAIAGFIGQSLIGGSFLGFTKRVPISAGISGMIITYIFSLASIFILGYTIDFFAPHFGSKKDLVASIKVAVFSYTAIWIIGILNVIPGLFILVIIGSLYSLYLFYLGIKSVKEVPEDKLLPYFIVTILAAIAIYVISGAIVYAMMMRSFSPIPTTVF